MEIDRKAFSELLGPLHELLDANLGLRILRAIPVLQSLNDTQRDAIVKMFRQVSYNENDVMLRKVCKNLHS